MQNQLTRAAATSFAPYSTQAAGAECLAVLAVDVMGKGAADWAQRAQSSLGRVEVMVATAACSPALARTYEIAHQAVP